MALLQGWTSRQYRLYGGDENQYGCENWMQMGQNQGGYHMRWRESDSYKD